MNDDFSAIRTKSLDIVTKNRYNKYNKTIIAYLKRLGC